MAKKKQRKTASKVKKASPQKPASSKKAAAQPKLLATVVRNYLPWILLGVALIIYFIARYSFLEIPLNRDEGSYGYLGRVAINGGTPYVDFYEMKPPGLYYIFGLLGSIFGFSESGLRMAIAFINLGSAAFLIGVGKNIFKNIKAGAVVGAVFLIMSLNLGHLGFSAVSEHYVNFFFAGCLYFLTRNRSPRDYIYAGAMVSGALLIKQTALFFLVATVIYIVIDHVVRKKSLKDIFWTGLKYGGTIAAVGIITLLFLYLSGGWNDFVHWIYDVSKNYSTVDEESKAAFYFDFFGKKFFHSFWIIGISSLIGLVYSLYKVKHEKWNILYLIIFLSFLGLSMTPGGRFYSQYWMLLIIPLAVFSGYIGKAIVNEKSLMISAAMAVGLGVVFMADFNHNKHYYLPDNVHRIVAMATPGNPFSEIRELSNYAERLSTSEDKFYVLGGEPQAYLYMDKMAPTRHIFPGLISTNIPWNKKAQFDAYKDLEDSRPKFVLFNVVPFSWGIQQGDIRTLYDNSYGFLSNNYRPIAYADLIDGRTRMVYGEQAQNYTPQASKYIVLYQRR